VGEPPSNAFENGLGLGMVAAGLAGAVTPGITRSGRVWFAGVGRGCVVAGTNAGTVVAAGFPAPETDGAAGTGTAAETAGFGAIA
jgi:hypothetical protein